MLVMAKATKRNETVIRCTNCDQVLGVLCAGHVAINHHGREVLADHVVAIRCERCGRIWKPTPLDNQPAE